MYLVPIPHSVFIMCLCWYAYLFLRHIGQFREVTSTLNHIGQGYHTHSVSKRQSGKKPTLPVYSFCYCMKRQTLLYATWVKNKNWFKFDMVLFKT